MSPVVNAATQGLLVTGRLTATTSEAGLAAALARRLAARDGLIVALHSLDDDALAAGRD